MENAEVLEVTVNRVESVMQNRDQGKSDARGTFSNHKTNINRLKRYLPQYFLRNIVRT